MIVKPQKNEQIDKKEKQNVILIFAAVAFTYTAAV